MSANGVKRRMETTQGWEINVQWKDGSTTWHKLKDAKDSHPLCVAEHAVENGIWESPSFKWWIPRYLFNSAPSAPAPLLLWDRIDSNDPEPVSVLNILNRHSHFTSMEPVPQSETIGKYFFLITKNKFTQAKECITNTLPQLWC
jgi:hypothetical protein